MKFYFCFTFHICFSLIHVLLWNALFFLQIVKNFTEESFASHIRSLISSDKTHDPQYYNITPYLDSMGTTHVSVLADDGSAVSVTSTINHMSVWFYFTVRNQPFIAMRVDDWKRFKRLWKKFFLRRSNKIIDLRSCYMCYLSISPVYDQVHWC